MNGVQAVIARYIETTAPGLDGEPVKSRALRFSKIVTGQATPPVPHDYPDSIADWCQRNGYIEHGATLGEREDLAVFWIASELSLTGTRPEWFEHIIGERITGATVAFYRSEGSRPAHLATSMTRNRIKAIRQRNPDAPGDVGIAKRDAAAFLRLMMGG